MNTPVNIIVFGLDRCPELCRPSFEYFLSHFCGNVDLYIGLISLDTKDPLCTYEQKKLAAWACDLKEKNPSCRIRICQVFSQANPDLYSNRELLDKALDACLSRLDIFYDDYRSIRNYLHYLYFGFCFSGRLAQLIEDRQTLLLRSDMIYGGLESSFFNGLGDPMEVRQRSAFVLGHDSFGFVNDRFIMSTAQNVISYMQRISKLRRYLMWPWRYFHSEKYASWFLLRRLNLHLEELPLSFWAKRVRSNGLILDDSNPLNCEETKAVYKLMFLRHSYWQIKLSLKKCMAALTSL